jgi:hypothetical protein
VGPEIELSALLGGLGLAALDLIENVAEHLAQEDGHDRGRGLVGAEPQIVAGAGDRGP